MEGINDTGVLSAVWHKARDVRIERRERPALSTGQVRLRVSLCGICGSDMHEYLDGPHAIPVKAPHPISGAAAPLVIGHEFTGTVIEAGNDSGFKAGQRVAVEPEYRCGVCAACRRGDYNLCESMGFAGLMGPGGMAEEAVLPGYMLHPLPDTVSDRQAAVLEPAAVALHALRRAGLTAGQSVAVIGAGPIGLLLVQLATVAGARRIVVSDVSEPRLARALALGATETVNSATGSLPAAAAGVDIAFEAVGLQAALDDAIGAVRKGGKVVLVGLFGAPARLDAFDIVNREVEVIPSCGYRHVYPDLIGMVAAGIVDPSLIVTREIRLEDAVTAGFESLAKPNDDVKVLIAP
ncbi:MULTISPECIES: 2,3-butanediol dehydrogenase [unclassified Rhizobium]|uniref:2,3-butanediol dehydrogenase n=1 Tax=unclassified Rhizobium TaxID=2613769 RepID=UPI0016119ADE|nr:MULTISPECIES: 2,3-butanediol dehydrogenase [unclassified Rhizobium]MBB3289073.1 (R,R)-butanediol dehydrogenase/meso-butanediol dehydrogenase/diacetyl reductase [Rhizobium sp. BK252]MBB3403815.1 (R,R)-butanediol dehydrogenase/meso-butanediol dehydrogenase/diacetyl reductase [Rhizobium sp. BK289]MBB3416516.1 (R,R)-butanediol dehydrogenase/meso-butanediol dehydrogenase/diacetyl reductase [Rhizobium sp. BK284]MBB3484278.1 (R,R)-butanediol dehydrogenase/meso-butanediol dehydrogenase/diacetyl redu